MILGATGLIGGEVVRQSESLNDVQLTAVIRSDREQNLSNTRWHKVNFDRLHQYEDLFQCDTLVITLGTTIKQAKSKAAFRKIDYEYAVMAAALAKQKGAQRVIVVTAIGAKENSRIFYNSVKGDLEQSLHRLQFKELQILQPSLLIGERDHARKAEDLGQKLAPVFGALLVGPLSKYKPIRGSQVASYIVSQLTAPITRQSIIVRYEQMR